MVPKVDIQPGLKIEDLLSHQYDQAGYKQSTFHEHYQKLVNHRDELRKQYDRKAKTRANLREPDGKTLNLQRSKGLTDPPSANPSKGSRFSILPDDDEGSSSSALSKPQLSASLNKHQLNELPDSQRKAEVRKIKEEIGMMKRGMKEQKRKDNESRKDGKDAKEGKEHGGGVDEDEVEADESGRDQGWEMGKSSRGR